MNRNDVKLLDEEDEGSPATVLWATFAMMGLMAVLMLAAFTCGAYLANQRPEIQIVQAPATVVEIRHHCAPPMPAEPGQIFDVPEHAGKVYFEGGKPVWLFAGPESYTPAEPEGCCPCGENCVGAPDCGCGHCGKLCCGPPKPGEGEGVVVSDPKPAIDPVLPPPEPEVLPAPEPCRVLPDPPRCRDVPMCRPRLRFFRNRCR